MATLILYLAPTIVAFGVYYLLGTFEQKYYAIKGIMNRHAPYDPSVWEEKNPDVLLWKVGALIGRSASGVIGLFGIEMARLTMMGYIVFRTQDTWADVAMKREDRIRGLGLLPKRYKRYDDGAADLVVGEDEGFEKVAWDLASRDRNRLYVEVTKNVHRFDSIYQRLIPLHQSVLREYAEGTHLGWAELELLQDAPVTHELMRKHAHVAIDLGFFGMCRAMSPELYAAIKTDEEEPKVHHAYIAFSSYIWYLNLAASIEEDVAEGVALDAELRAMNGMDQEVVDRVRVRWLIIATQELMKSGDFLFHPALASNWTLRIFILQFFQTSYNVSEKYFFLVKDGKYERKSIGASSLFKTFVRSMTKNGYRAGVDSALHQSEVLLHQLKAIASK